MPSPAEMGKAYFDQRGVLPVEEKKKKKAYIKPVVPTVVDPVVPPIINPVVDPVAPVVDPTAPVDPAFNITDPTQEFNYDPAQDTMAQAALREKNRQIGNAMNRRGIYGSTIMQENISSADAQLIDTYAQMAQQKYDRAVSDRQNKIEIAFANAKKRGYYSNEEAALVGGGIKPGDRVYSASTSGGSGTKKDAVGNDGTKYKADGTIIYDTRQLANKKELMGAYEGAERDTIWRLANNTILTQSQIDEIIDSIPGAQQYYEEYLRMLSEGHRFPNSSQYVAYLRQGARRTPEKYDTESKDFVSGTPYTDPSKYESDKKTWADMDAYWKSRGY